MLAPSQLELWSAIEAGDAPKARECIANGARVSMRNRAGWTALHRACMGGSAECVELVLEAAPKEEQPARPPGAPPPAAAHVQLSDLLAAPDETGNTPLHLAAGGAHLEAVRLLLRAGAKPNEPSPSGAGSTPMHAACGALASASGPERCAALVDVILALLGGGALLEAVDSRGVMAVQLLPKPWMLRVLSRVRALAPGAEAEE